MSPEALARLAALRLRIDALDDALLALVAERAAVVDEIASLKASEQAPMRDPGRERALAERWVSARPARLTREAVETLLDAVLRACFPGGR